MGRTKTRSTILARAIARGDFGLRQRRRLSRPDQKRLKELARWLVANAGGDVKVFVDTAAVMEKPLAAKPDSAGRASTPIWCRANSARGCFSARSSPRSICRLMKPSKIAAAACRACLDVCPDRGLPRTLPARCAALHFLSDHRAQRPDPARAAPDDGQPHLRLRRLSRRLPVEQVRAGRPRSQTRRARSCCARRSSPILSRLDDAQFRELFSKTSIKRTGRDRFIRNVLNAIGNSGDLSLAAEAERLLNDASPLVRGAAVWALSRLLPREKFSALAEKQNDSDETVQ